MCLNRKMLSGNRDGESGGRSTERRKRSGRFLIRNNCCLERYSDSEGQRLFELLHLLLQLKFDIALAGLGKTACSDLFQEPFSEPQACCQRGCNSGRLNRSILIERLLDAG